MKTLVDEFISYCELKGKSPLTIRNYRSYLGKFSDFLNNDLSAVTLDSVDRFQASLVKSECSFQTQSYYLIAIRNFLKWLRVRKDMDVLDPQKIELPKFRRKILDALSDDEAKRLLRAAAGSSRPDRQQLRSRAIVEMLLGSGIRVSELCSLKVTQVDLKEKFFRVVGKGNKERVCFLNDSTIHALKTYLATRRNDTPYLFSRHDRTGDERLSTRSIERLIKECGERAGIQKVVTPHVLRRTFGAALLRKGVDLRYIQELLGHDSIQTTQFYTKIERSDLENVYRKASNKNAKSVKENDVVILSRESFAKLTGMVGKTMQNQNEILQKLEKEEKKSLPIPQRAIIVN